MSVKLRTEHHLEILSLNGGTGSSESTLVKMPHCWIYRVAAHKMLKIKGFPCFQTLSNIVLIMLEDIISKPHLDQRMLYIIF